MEVPSRAMALGVPAKIRPDAVTEDMVMANVGGYLRHIKDHREGMAVLALEDCITTNVGLR